MTDKERYINKAGVKRLIKRLAPELQIGKNVFASLNGFLEQQLSIAIQRTKLNKRKTVKPQDLMIRLSDLILVNMNQVRIFTNSHGVRIAKDTGKAINFILEDKIRTQIMITQDRGVKRLLIRF
jgi:histone H3/H4